jgi:hypothetical protein
MKKIYRAITAATTMLLLTSCDGPRPWENVFAIYYPNAADLTNYERVEVSTLEECRDWVFRRAYQMNDPQLVRGGL